MRWGDRWRDREALDRHLTTEPEWRQDDERPNGTMGPDNDPVFEPLVIENRALMVDPNGKRSHGTIVTVLDPETGTATYVWKPDE